MDAYAMFYIDLKLVILAKMKHHIRRYSAALKGDVQTLGRQELDSKLRCSTGTYCKFRNSCWHMALW